jgi:hypothetical protein
MSPILILNLTEEDRFDYTTVIGELFLDKFHRY